MDICFALRRMNSIEMYQLLFNCLAGFLDKEDCNFIRSTGNSWPLVPVALERFSMLNLSGDVFHG
jgi:hypothetical protein